MKKSLLVIFGVIILVAIIMVTWYFLSGGMSDSEINKILSKKDPVTGGGPIELMEEGNFEGLERAGVTPEEWVILLENELVNEEKFRDQWIKKRNEFSESQVDEKVKKALAEMGL